MTLDPVKIYLKVRLNYLSTPNPQSQQGNATNELRVMYTNADNSIFNKLGELEAWVLMKT